MKINKFLLFINIIVYNYLKNMLIPDPTFYKVYQKFKVYWLEMHKPTNEHQILLKKPL